MSANENKEIIMFSIGDDVKHLDFLWEVMDVNDDGTLYLENDEGIAVDYVNPADCEKLGMACGSGGATTVGQLAKAAKAEAIAKAKAMDAARAQYNAGRGSMAPMRGR
jgi:hypothetical protein